MQYLHFSIPGRGGKKRKEENAFSAKGIVERGEGKKGREAERWSHLIFLKERGRRRGEKEAGKRYLKAIRTEGKRGGEKVIGCARTTPILHLHRKGEKKRVGARKVISKGGEGKKKEVVNLHPHILSTAQGKGGRKHKKVGRQGKEGGAVLYFLSTRAKKELLPFVRGEGKRVTF